MKNQPICSIMLPNWNSPWSFGKLAPSAFIKAGLNSLPTDIKIPPAGITATTIISAFENLCQNSNPNFSFPNLIGCAKNWNVPDVSAKDDIVFTVLSFIDEADFLRRSFITINIIVN